MYLRCAEGLGDLHSIRSLSNRREVCLRHGSSEEVPFVIRLIASRDRYFGVRSLPDEIVLSNSDR